MAFQFPLRVRKKQVDQPVPAIHGILLKNNPESVGEIQGRPPGSVEEWRVAVALWKYNIQFVYQYPINGGRLRRGGQVIDFLVYNPFPVAVYVQGEYWHQGQMGAEDKLKQAEARNIFKRDPVILWGRELQTQDDANTAVRKFLL